MSAPGPKSLQKARSVLLHDLLELAIGVARHDMETDPSLVPLPLRPVVRLSRLGPRALAAADRAGDDDPFRSRVALLVELEKLTPAQRLWLERPDGWEAALEEMVQVEAADVEEADVRQKLTRERRARRSAEDSRDRAVAQAGRTRLEATDLRQELAATRQDLAAARQAADEAEDRARAAEDERTEAVRALKQLEEAHARAHEQLRELREGGTGQAARRAEVDRAALARAVAQATDASTALDAALAAVAALAEPTEPTAPTEPAPAGPGDGTEAPDEEPDAAVEAGGPPEGSPPARPPARARRRPARLPGGIHDDTAEAADHLVRRPGAILLVDGYNASLAMWPDTPLADQRQRLVSGLAVLEARSGVEAVAVFDGVAASVQGVTRQVRVRFTDEGVEADDVLLDMVDAEPPDRVVVVASNDERVRAGSRARGGNVLSISQLRALLG
ncbi:MAG TPA: NYN domain-containing protein [Acidimicrobiales bacterium]|nr:NYN domain-containing protein [Acidimicrobiales bacterium]